MLDESSDIRELDEAELVLRASGGDQSALCLLYTSFCNPGVVHHLENILSGTV